MNNILIDNIFWVKKLKNKILLCFYKSEFQHSFAPVLNHSKNIGKCNAI